MKIIPRENSEKYSLPLPLYHTSHIADAISRLGDEFDVYIGLPKEYVEELKKLSLDESDVDLQRNTGDRRRFGEGSYEDWYKRNRTPFALVDKRSNRLAALVWFGPKMLGQKSLKFGDEVAGPVSGEYDWHTISVRSYPKFRGKGIMQNFVKFAMDVYRDHFPGVKFWIGTDYANIPAVRLFRGLGFVENETHSDLDNGWLVMTKEDGGV